jgi:hypothetical protein
MMAAVNCPAPAKILVKDKMLKMECQIAGYCMRTLSQFRSGKPSWYPDQAIYAAFACSEFGLAFREIDGRTGLVFKVASSGKSTSFGAGRASWYPQNSATAATLASDKYFADRILADAGVPTLGGEYFFLHDRHRVHRPGGHERGDALEYLRRLGGTGFVKPLLGSRGDFAQVLHGEASLVRYLGEVAPYYDAILIQKLTSGLEYRVFLLDDEVVYTARKYPPFVLGDGVRSIRELLTTHNAALQECGLSPADARHDDALETVLPNGERWEIPGRMNLSAGGTMVLEAAGSEAISKLAKQAAKALGLRVAAVDVFTGVDGEQDAMAVIEVNANPAIRLLEQSGRSDLILKIWRHTFAAMELL